MAPFKRFIIAVCLVVLIVTGGMVGYTLIEGWSLNDSLYMAFITLTTVGFNEVHPLSETGRHFTIVYLVFSIATVGYSFTTLISYIFEGIFIQTMRERRMKKNIKKIKDHFIICGGGDTGREVALEFKRCGVKFLIIDLNPEESELGRDESILFVKGDAVDDEVLIEANIEHARGLVSVLTDDEANVFTVLSARQLNPDLMIVAKVNEEPTVKKLLKAGADRVISPKQIAGRRLASIVLRPSVVNFLDVVVDGAGVDIPMRLEEIEIEPGSPLVDKTLRESGIGQRTGALIIGIHGPDGRTRINPTSTMSLASARLRENDILIVLGSEEQLDKLRHFMKKGG